MYISTCSECKEQRRDVCYIGETSRSLAERVEEHIADGANQEEFSHIHNHKTESNMEEEGLPGMKLSIEKKSKSALKRQLREAIVINKCLLPELGIINQTNGNTDEEVKKKCQEEKRIDEDESSLINNKNKRRTR